MRPDWDSDVGDRHKNNREVHGGLLELVTQIVREIVMAGSDANWGGSANAGISVIWTTGYSGDGPEPEDQSPGCTFQINDGNDGPTVAGVLIKAFNKANQGSPYSAGSVPGFPSGVQFEPAADVTGMTANGVPVTSVGITIAGMTVQEINLS